MSKEAFNSSSGPDQGSDRPTLFEIPAPPAPSPVPTGAPRVQRPDRYQVRILSAPLDALLAEDHQARMVWGFVEGLDLSPLYDSIRAVEGRAGRDPIEPRILMALWLYATLDGVGSARQVAFTIPGVYTGKHGIVAITWLVHFVSPFVMAWLF